MLLKIRFSDAAKRRRGGFTGVYTEKFVNHDHERGTVQMGKLKKVLALVLIAMIVSVSLAGCGGSEHPSGDHPSGEHPASEHPEG